MIVFLSCHIRVYSESTLCKHVGRLARNLPTPEFPECEGIPCFASLAKKVECSFTN